jgi:DNA-binding IclR family transcriptional regulator
MPESQPDDELAALDLLLSGFQISRLLRLVADLGVADRVTPDGGVSVGDLARDCGVQPQPLMRVLQALAAFGVVTVAADGSVAPTPRSRLLRTDRPNSLHLPRAFGLHRSACERTEAEFRNLLAQAGFALRRVISTGSSVSILEAVAA